MKRKIRLTNRTPEHEFFCEEHDLLSFPKHLRKYYSPAGFVKYAQHIDHSKLVQQNCQQKRYVKCQIPEHPLKTI